MSKSSCCGRFWGGLKDIYYSCIDVIGTAFSTPWAACTLIISLTVSLISLVVRIGIPFIVAYTVEMITGEVGATLSNLLLIFASMGIAILTAPLEPEIRKLLTTNNVVVYIQELVMRVVGQSMYLSLDDKLATSSGRLPHLIGSIIRTPRLVSGLFNEIIPNTLEFIVLAICIFVTGGLYAGVPISGLLSLVLGGVYVLTTFICGSIYTRMDEKVLDAGMQNKHKLMQAVKRYKVAHYFNRVEFELAEYEEDLGDYIKPWRLKQLIPTIARMAQKLITTLGVLGLVGYEFYNFYTSMLTSQKTDFIQARKRLLVNSFLFRLATQLNNLPDVMIHFLGGFVEHRKIREYLQQEPVVQENPEARELTLSEAPEISFDNVTFKHGDRVVLDRISFTIQPGRKTFIVGQSGAGKSTILDLIARFRDVDSGYVLINDEDISKFSFHSLRKPMSIVPQETNLYRKTIEDNIRYGKEDASVRELEDSIEVAGLTDTVREFSLGLQKVVGEEGGMLSTGERQRVGIARAVLKDAQIVLLDEPTASLDSETERGVRARLIRACDGRTAVWVTHKLHLLNDADYIIIIQDGRVAEQGTYQELISKRGGCLNELMQEYLKDVQQEVELEEVFVDPSDVYRVDGARAESCVRRRLHRVNSLPTFFTSSFCKSADDTAIPGDGRSREKRLQKIEFGNS